MSEAISGQRILTIEDDNSGETIWIGSLNIPKKIHASPSFEAFSYQAPYSTEPIKLIGQHEGSLVRGWLDLNRPVTLIEPFSTYQGAGALFQGGRITAKTRGKVATLVEGEHLTGQEQEIREIGFWSESLTSLCEFHDKEVGAEIVEDNPYVSRRVLNYDQVVDLGKLKLALEYRRNDQGVENLDRAYFRTEIKQDCSIWKAISWIIFQLAFVDFLTGRNSGRVKFSVIAQDGVDRNLRVTPKKRSKRDHSADMSARLGNAAIDLPALFRKAWEDEGLKTRVFVATGLLSNRYGIIERFLQTMAFLEKWLRKRYQTTLQAQQLSDFEHGKDAFLRDTEKLSKESKLFAEQFAQLKAPQSPSLKHLLETAIDECGILGLTLPDKYERKLVKFRSQIAHGDKFQGASWAREVCIASDVGLSIIELLTAKDLGLEPNENFFPRRDRLGFQEGIFS